MAVSACACAHPVERTLSRAAAQDRIPEGFVVVYDDRHAMWGGRRITLWEDGRLEVVRWQPGRTRTTPLVWHGRVAPPAVLAVVDHLVTLRAWEQWGEPALPTRAQAMLAPLDNGRVWLTVRAGKATSTVWEWANDAESLRRLVLVRNQLETITRRARPDFARRRDAH
jgi:hypothetical protein